MKGALVVAGVGEVEEVGEVGMEELAMGSVVYMGRGSFRMEAVFGHVGDGASNDLDDDGAPREVTGIVTSPYAAGERKIEVHLDDLDLDDATDVISRVSSSSRWRKRPPRSLFASPSGEGIPLLAAPTGAAIEAPVPRASVDLSRAAVTALGVLLLASGIVFGGAARRLLMPRPGAAPIVSADPDPAPAPAHTFTIEATGPEPIEAAALAPLIIPLPEPVVIRAHKKAASLAQPTEAAPAKTLAPAERAAEKWVDPFAD
jgi:hypothetical protein